MFIKYSGTFSKWLLTSAAVTSSGQRKVNHKREKDKTRQFPLVAAAILCPGCVIFTDT